MSYRIQMNRFNVRHQPVPYDSREYGYLTITLVQLASLGGAPNSGSGGAPNSGSGGAPNSGSGGASESSSSATSNSASNSTGLIVNPIKIRFVPDPKLSVNQIMEFKNFTADMRMVLSHNQADGGLKLCFRDGQLSFHLIHYTSEIEIRIPEPDLIQIAKILDQLCVVVATNTFFKLDLVEIKQSTKKSYQEISNYLWSAWK